MERGQRFWEDQTKELALSGLDALKFHLIKKTKSPKKTASLISVACMILSNVNAAKGKF